ncbi:ATP-binding protein [Methanosarcina mazei]|jgi:hypothetical protein|uniref:ATP-binding protein n=1 Tax=Methanosarcina mazei TaxID=2209 RepID=A0A0F8I7E3_METMZ|nr:ATP-binding protein [Methanosarcina mazei]KKG13677.1 ATP-binding protein [Methanosarcina mazei]KKG28512.1 ATP-binding protein [Methanosarcina mazei]KKG40840.1 ATP-binding protein [Methanosarcina mazei]KKG45590.1 ATP-binding protein [Methanosarcina mazei]KKG46795.1 ATP-binding protein [Methanosarcina mazei]
MEKYLEKFEGQSDDFDIAEPDAGALIESLRAFGYDLQTAIADLIDNSISAGAANVWLNFYWNGDNSIISIKDDGCGMTEEELINAMRPGSRNPLEERNPRDLGRFGLGLKTASFSQCRKLTVATKSKDCSITKRCWDLDYVIKTREWRLLKENCSFDLGLLNELGNLDQGTVVFWENIDRVVAGTKVGDAKDQKLFFERVDNVKVHLSMVFHRFMEKKNGLKIWINDREIEPWDPFLKKEKSTQLLNEEKFISAKIIVNPYVLPHNSKISEEVHLNAAGPKGWNAAQGFYVYRNERLIVAGDWLGLGFKKEEHYKLARIQVDIPNSMDNEWKIDVKKSVARPPSFLRDDLKRIAKLTRKRAAEVYRHRGKVIARTNSSEFVYIWEQKVRHGKIFYTLNRNHPLLREIFEISGENLPKLSAMIRMIEETVPIPLITLNNYENPDKHSKPFEKTPSSEIIDVMHEVYDSLIYSGIPRTEARERLLSMDPFSDYPEFVLNYIEDTDCSKEGNL